MTDYKELKIDLTYLASTYGLYLTGAEIHEDPDGRLYLEIEGTPSAHRA